MIVEFIQRYALTGALIGLGLATAWGGVQAVRLANLEASVDRADKQRAEDALTESEARRLQARDRAANAERIDRATLTKTRAAEAAAGSRRAVGDGLRIALAADRQPAGADAGQCIAERARATKLAGLLDESRQLLAEGAGIVEQAVIRVDGLQERAEP